MADGEEKPEQRAAATADDFAGAPVAEPAIPVAAPATRVAEIPLSEVAPPVAALAPPVAATASYAGRGSAHRVPYPIGPVIEGPPPATLVFAASLEEARRGAVVHVDGDGQVRSPARYRILNAAALGVSGGLLVAGTAAWVSLFGPPGAAVAAFLGGMFVVGMRRRRELVQVVALISEGRLVEAEALCRSLVSGRMVPRKLRAAAHHNLSLIAQRRGDFGEALAELHLAARLRRMAGGRGVDLDLIAYEEIRILVNLDRVPEARARLLARGRTPEGNYLRYLHQWAELAVQFGEGRLALGDGEDDLWERSRAALRITGAAQLLALCAWAHSQRGDDEMADHLLVEARDRAEPESALSFPSLWAWAEARLPRR